VIARIERVDGVRNLESILGADWFDGFFVGPYDLSGSLGRPGSFEHPEMREALAEVTGYVSPDGPLSGIHVVAPDPQELDAAIADCYRFTAFASEVTQARAHTSR
jgi:2-dehydro-3-deoxyglucarate aldolase